MLNWTISDKSLSVGFDINDRNITKSKVWFGQKWPNNYNLSPHIGLVFLPLPEDTYRSAMESAFKFISNWRIKPNTVIRQIAFEINREEDVFVKFLIDKNWIEGQHNLLLNHLIEFRPLGMIRLKDLERVKENKYSAEEVKNLYNYGFIKSKNLFDPHITLGLIKKEDWNGDTETVIKNRFRGLINHKVMLDRVHIIYHTDAAKQINMKTIDRFDIKL